nr:RHS repeat-associated core domain-containing protein [Pseudomonas brassicacearum]
MNSQLFYQGTYLRNKLSSELQCSSLLVNTTPYAESLVARHGPETMLLTTDNQDSVIQAHTTSATAFAAYTPYGHNVPEARPLSMYAFNGEWRDSVTGCYPLGTGYRFFNPILMRFHSPDGISPFADGGPNYYAYCAGDPINFQDPSGHVRVPLASISLNRGPRPSVPPLTRRIVRRRLASTQVALQQASDLSKNAHNRAASLAATANEARRLANAAQTSQLRNKYNADANTNNSLAARARTLAEELARKVEHLKSIAASQTRLLGQDNRENLISSPQGPNVRRPLASPDPLQIEVTRLRRTNN